MNDWRQKIFDELDYLKEKEEVLEKREKLMQLLLPENEETFRKFIMEVKVVLEKKSGQPVYIEKSRKAREKFFKELCDILMPPP